MSSAAQRERTFNQKAAGAQRRPLDLVYGRRRRVVSFVRGNREYQIRTCINYIGRFPMSAPHEVITEVDASVRVCGTHYRSSTDTENLPSPNRNGFYEIVSKKALRVSRKRVVNKPTSRSVNKRERETNSSHHLKYCSIKYKNLFLENLPTFQIRTIIIM